MTSVVRGSRPEVDFFQDRSFGGFRAVLDEEVLEKGVGTKKRQAEPLTEEAEEELWKTGQLRRRPFPSSFGI